MTHSCWRMPRRSGHPCSRASVSPNRVSATPCCATSHAAITDHDAYFADLYPNGNSLHGHWLVTAQETGPTIEQRHALDQATLHAIDDILSQAPGASAAHVLRRVRARLAEVAPPMPR